MANIKIYDSQYNHLKEIDWDFLDEKQDEISSLHPYPARFIESIPRSLIDALGVKPGTSIMDPFCGSGTTLLEAKKKGIDSVGVDLNPIACLISKVKTQQAQVNLVEVGNEICDRAETYCLKHGMEIPNIPNLDHWFKSDIQKSIYALVTEINNIDNIDLQNALRFCLSSIIVRVSNQESDTRYAAIEKGASGKDVFKSFRTALERLKNAQSKIDCSDTNTKIINKDILAVNSDDVSTDVSLVITSPPYPNAYEYWLYHKYRMWWLGYDPIDVREHEIGARPHYQKKNGQTEKDFYNQMSSVFKLIDEVLVTGGHVCIVIGRSVIKGRTVDNALLIRNIANDYKYTCVADIERTIAASRKSFNLKYGKIKTENILIFRKEETSESKTL